MSDARVKLLNANCCVVFWLDAPDGSVRTLNRSTIASIYIWRRKSGDAQAQCVLSGGALDLELASYEEARRLASWHVGQPIPPPEILSIEDETAYESAYTAWLAATS